MDTPPGLDLDAVSSWLAATRPGLTRAPLRASMIAGGKSNLTYRVTDGVTAWALRRPPLGHVLPTAHDMAREFRVISGLAPMGIPVPEPVVLCSDLDVIGAPFYLMSFVDGTVIDSDAAVAAVRGGTAARLGQTLIDCLLALHAVDLSAAGLADFGRPDGFLRRQLIRWDKQWQASVGEPLSAQAEVVELLTTSLPVSGRASAV